MGDFDAYPPNMRELLERVADAGYAHVLRDEDAGDRFLFDALADSPDPVLREMGHHLRAGEIGLGQLATMEGYREALHAGTQHLGDLDMEQLLAEADAAFGPQDVETPQSDQPQPPEAPQEPAPSATAQEAPAEPKRRFGYLGDEDAR